MNRILHIIFVAVFGLLVFSACEKQAKYEFSVDCTVDPSFARDSVSLWILDEDYNRPLLLATDNSSESRFSLKGQIDRPALAYLKFNNDSSQFFFVLEPTTISIAINTGNVIINGGNGNRQYASFIRQYKNVLNRILSNNRQYVKLVCDSTLSREKERELAQRDSTLCDSLQRMVVNAINQQGPVAQIIRQRYFHALDSAHISNLHD